VKTQKASVASDSARHARAGKWQESIATLAFCAKAKVSQQER
jgi:hypothetical protein